MSGTTVFVMADGMSQNESIKILLPRFSICVKINISTIVSGYRRSTKGKRILPDFKSKFNTGIQNI